MHRVLKDRELTLLFVIDPGERQFAPTDRITALPLDLLVATRGEYNPS